MKGFLHAMFGFAVIFFVGWLIFGSSSGPETTVASIDKSETAQTGREDLIEKLIAQGIFQKVEVPGDLPRVWVTPQFQALDFDTKQKFVSVVYAYHFDGTNMGDAVRLFDSQTGKEIGAYTGTGLSLS